MEAERAVGPFRCSAGQKAQVRQPPHQYSEVPALDPFARLVAGERATATKRPASSKKIGFLMMQRSTKLQLTS